MYWRVGTVFRFFSSLEELVAPLFAYDIFVLLYPIIVSMKQ